MSFFKFWFQFQSRFYNSDKKLENLFSWGKSKVAKPKKKYWKPKTYHFISDFVQSINLFKLKYQFRVCSIHFCFDSGFQIVWSFSGSSSKYGPRFAALIMRWKVPFIAQCENCKSKRERLNFYITILVQGSFLYGSAYVLQIVFGFSRFWFCSHSQFCSPYHMLESSFCWVIWKLRSQKINIRNQNHIILFYVCFRLQFFFILCFWF